MPFGDDLPLLCPSRLFFFSPHPLHPLTFLDSVTNCSHAVVARVGVVGVADKSSLSINNSFSPFTFPPAQQTTASSMKQHKARTTNVMVHYISRCDAEWKKQQQWRSISHHRSLTILFQMSPSITPNTIVSPDGKLKWKCG
jgi:hypothetical protein